MSAGRSEFCLRALSQRASRSWPRLLPVALACSLSGCAATEEEEEELNLAAIRQGVQYVWVGKNETITTTGVNLLRAGSRSRKGRATGNLILDGGNGVKYTCGVTFIDHVHAITAAHCVDAGSGVTTSTVFKVRQYDTTALTDVAFTTQSAVRGVWPDFRRPVPMTAAQGYRSWDVNCSMVSRCAYGRTSNCPFTQTVDIALIKCPTRSTSELNYVDVAPSDSGTGNVEIWWFHEVVNLSISPTHFIPYAPANNFQNYGFYPGENNLTQNYHYWHSSADTDPQLLPLLSRHSSSNVQYKALGNEGVITRTNIPVCHGTSGSGYFKTGTDQVLGVCSNFGTQHDSTKLCESMTVSSKENGSAYTQQFYSMKMKELAEDLN